MLPDTPSPAPAPDERRAYYRITVVLPLSLQEESDTREAKLAEQSVNLSGGGIGLTVNKRYDSDAILLLSVCFPDHGIFKAYLEVVRVEPVLTSHLRAYRLHGRFVRMATQDRELLIRYIMRFQRDHLQKHYLA